MRTILQNYSKLFIVVFGFLVHFTSSAQTPFTATYTFSGDENVLSFDYNGTVYDGIAVSPIAKVGVNSINSNNNFRANNWPTGATNGSNTFTGSVDLGKYIEFSVANIQGYKYTITSINYGIARNGAGPRQSQWRGSNDGFSSTLSNYTTLATGLTNSSGTVTSTDNGTSWLNNVLDVSTSYTNQTAASTFRLYFFNSEDVNGNGGLQGAITISGTYELEPFPVAIAASTVGAVSFQANWQAVPGATSYQLDVSTSPTFDTLLNASDLFISEYIEGSSNNKYLEIYNGTGAAVNLANYALVLYGNGSNTATQTQPLSGTLAQGTSVVYRHNSAALPGTGSYTAYSNVINFTGNDAIALFNTNTVSLVDVIGSIGTDPGGAWTFPGISTQNRTLVRKSTVSSGLTTNPASNFPTLATEWDQFPSDTNASLGTHIYNPMIPFFVSGYEDLTVNGTSQVVTGLDPETTYYYRVRAFNGEISINSNVIQVTTFEEIPVTQVVASQCDGTLSELYGRINVNSVPGATMYRYRVARATAPTTYEFFESPYPRFRLNNFTTLEINFGLTYLVAVQTARVYNGNTFWSEFGTECSITTPAPSTVVVTLNQCGQTLPSILSRILINNVVPNANLYRYRIALQSNPNIFQEIESPFGSIRLNNLTTVPLTSDTNYLISVQARIIIEGNEVWTEYSTPCVITTPDFPTTSIQVAQCGDEDGAYAVSSLTEKLFCDFLSGASYRFKIEKYDNNVLIYSQTVTNPINWITLSSFTGLQPGETYNISVAYNYYGEGPFDKVCTLMVPALNLKPSDTFENSVSNLTTEFKATAYPNPFRNSFALNVTTTSQTAVQLAVFDMTGRILDTRTVAVSALESLAIGENYPAGVYNVVISQDDQLQTIRVIKQ